MKDPATTVEPHYTLRQAVAKFFPGGPLTVASLRNEIQKGRLRATMPAGKLLVTETAIAEMLEKCRVQASSHTSLASERHRESSSGSSETERIERAQAAASAVITRQRNESSPITSTTSTSHQKATSRSSTKSLRLISKTTPRGLQITTIPDRYREADFELGRGKKLSDVTGANREICCMAHVAALSRTPTLRPNGAARPQNTARCHSLVQARARQFNCGAARDDAAAITATNGLLASTRRGRSSHQNGEEERPHQARSTHAAHRRVYRHSAGRNLGTSAAPIAKQWFL
jgi:hypothetical protein